MNNRRAGFTIIELLIVIVIIAILVAITIIAYNGITNKANQASAQSAAEQAYKKVLAYTVENADQVPTDLATAGISNSGGTSYQYSANSSANPQTFCLTATTANVSYYVDNQNHNTPSAGACAGQAPDGETVVENLMINPSAESGTGNILTYGGASVASSTAWAASGTHSFQLTSAAPGDQGDMRPSPGGGLTGFPSGMSAGQTYTISAHVYIPVSFTGGYDRGPGILYWYSTNGSTFYQQFGPKVPQAAGVYTTSYTFTIPNNATGAVFGFGCASSTANQTVYYDSIMVTQGSTLYNFADGNSPGWAWTGTPNNSTSTGPAL